MIKISFKDFPEIGSKDYWNKILDMEDSIELSTDELISLLPFEIITDSNEKTYLYIRKVSECVYQVTYNTWKNVYKKNFEYVNFKYWQAPTLKLALYMAYNEIVSKD